MRDYAQIMNTIRKSRWLITPEGLNIILDIMDKHISGEMTDEQIANSIELGESRSERKLQSYKGLGILPISGPIFGKANLMTEFSGAQSLESFTKDFREMMVDDSINSILLQIDSPGGTDQLVHETGDLIHEARSTKPIYAIADGQMGSAALWLGSQANEIYSTQSGSVGSIGAYTVHEDRSKADADAGRKYTFISAGPFKTEANPHEPLSAEAKAYHQEGIDELYGQFVDVVARGRNVTTDKVKDDFGGGRMMTPSKALEAGLIDGITSFDNLVGHLVSQPRKVQVAIGDGKFASAVLTGNKLILSGSMSQEEIIKALESKEWEHSEPGTGSPPKPRTDEDGSDDPAIKGGWRRDPLPLDPSDPAAPKPNSKKALKHDGGESMDTEQLSEFAKLLGLPEDSTEETVFATMSTRLTELAEFERTVKLNTQQKQFATEYPEVWEEHQSLLEGNKQNTAEKFAEGIKIITRVEGDKEVPTKIGLSTLALESITDAHKKFAMGSGTLADFEKCITTITKGGTLELGEQGSQNPGPEKLLIDTSTQSGVHAARKMFAEKVAEIQTADSLSYEKAIKIAGERFPDLAEAYATVLHG